MEYRILKNNQVGISYDDYHKIIRNNKLYDLNHIENQKLIKEKEKKELFNLSLKEIAKNFSNNFMNMLNESVELVDKYLINKQDLNNDSFISDFLIIFMKEDRLIYSGIFFIIISIFIYFHGYNILIFNTWYIMFLPFIIIFTTISFMN